MAKTSAPRAHTEGESNTSEARAAWRAGNDDAPTRALIERDAGVFLHQSLSSPVLSAIAGAGAGIALLADTVVMGEGATIGFPFFRVGLVPDYGIFFSLPRRVGVARARQILLYARMVKGKDAYDIGLADALVDDDEVEARAVECAQELAAMPPHAFAIAKRQLGLWPTSLEGALEMEAMAQAACFSTSEFAEGRAAFRDKRAPNFRG